MKLKYKKLLASLALGAGLTFLSNPAPVEAAAQIARADMPRTVITQDGEVDDVNYQRLKSLACNCPEVQTLKNSFLKVALHQGTVDIAPTRRDILAEY